MLLNVMCCRSYRESYSVSQKTKILRTSCAFSQLLPALHGLLLILCNAHALLIQLVSKRLQAELCIIQSSSQGYSLDAAEVSGES